VKKEEKEKDRKGREGASDSSAIWREKCYIWQVLRGDAVNSLTYKTVDPQIV